MKVKELIEMLQKVDQELQVIHDYDGFNSVVVGVRFWEGKEEGIEIGRFTQKKVNNVVELISESTSDYNALTGCGDVDMESEEECW